MSSVNSAQTIHDIRNALNVIMTSAQLLRGPEPLTDKQQKSVDRIMHGSKEILALLGDHGPEDLSERPTGVNLTVTVVEKEKSPDENPGELATENKILFVDDDAETLEGYRQLLESEFRVETAVGAFLLPSPTPRQASEAFISPGVSAESGTVQKQLDLSISSFRRADFVRARPEQRMPRRTGQLARYGSWRTPFRRK